MATDVRFGAAPADLDSIFSDRVAFRAWYDEVLPPVYRYLLARCGGDVALAEELTQRTFVQAIRHRDQFDGRASAVTWLCSIARNQLVDHYRRTDRRRRRDLRLMARRTESGVDVWSAHERRAGVDAALAELPEPQRLVLMLRYLDDLPVREVAAAIGRSDKATESLLSRAREAFRRAYGALES